MGFRHTLTKPLRIEAVAERSQRAHTFSLGTVDMCAFVQSRSENVRMLKGAKIACVGQRPKDPASFGYDAWTLLTLFPRPSFPWVHACFTEKVAEGETTRRRVRATADVPILWTHHPAPQTILPRMRKSSQASLGVMPKGQQRCHSVVIVMRSTLPR
jgi:hypothetical protein